MLKQLKNGTVLVFRFNNVRQLNQKRLAQSHPCRNCLKYLKKHKRFITNIVFSNDKGYFEKKVLADMQPEDCYVSSGFAHLDKWD